MVYPHVLDNPGWASLSGPHAGFAEIYGLARRYPVDVSPFGAIEENRDPQSWRDLAALIGPNQRIVLSGSRLEIPDAWRTSEGGTGVQLVGDEVEGKADVEVEDLKEEDIPEMLDLVSRTKPGPFLPRTIELGRYLGFRIDNQLIAMAGSRLHPSGWREISAVCTDSIYRGRGLGTRLINAVVADIKSEGNTPFLHASATNINAIRLYEKLGFRLRVRTTFAVVQAPALPI
jgi:GNAT superfamily N-acetyltransferase